MRRPLDSSPSAITWLIAVVSLVLPWAGVALIFASVWHLTQANDAWLRYAVAGLALIVLDILIDFVWARRALGQTDLPDLNVRGAQLVGRVFTLAEPIEGGLGKIRCDDTLWQVEGPDLPAGHAVRVLGAKGMRLTIAPL